MEYSTEEQMVLTCKECGEQLMLFGPVEDWRSRDAVLLCKSAHQITLDDYDAREEVIATS